MIKLRMVMPNSVTNPTNEPTDNNPPVANTASTPPTNAKGRFARINSTCRHEPNSTASNSTMPVPASSKCTSRSCFA